jgi:hypothetical protein
MSDKPEARPPKYWRDPADEARAMADGLTTEANRARVLSIAENYERLADETQMEQERRGAPGAAAPRHGKH